MEVSPSKRSRSVSSNSSTESKRKKKNNNTNNNNQNHKKNDSASSTSTSAKKAAKELDSTNIAHIKERIAALSQKQTTFSPNNNRHHFTSEELEEEKRLIYDVICAILCQWPRSMGLLDERFINLVLSRVRPVLLSQPMLVPVKAPTNICGDIHGQIHDLIEIFKVGGIPDFADALVDEDDDEDNDEEEDKEEGSASPNKKKKKDDADAQSGKHNYLFLGDYVDRGKYGSEVICVLLGLKYLFPKRVYMLRGNHETDSICRIYGFFDECKRRFSVKLFKNFTDVFNVLPVAANVEDLALCMHGGISPELKNLRQIENISRPLIVGDGGLACDLLWSDPDESGNKGWSLNERGVSYTFSAEVVKHTLEMLDKDIIIRAHQVVEKGYSFFGGRSLVTVFSASNYCGEFTNSGAMMVMDKDCRCSFRIFKPVYDVDPAQQQTIHMF